MRAKTSLGGARLRLNEPVKRSVLGHCAVGHRVFSWAWLMAGMMGSQAAVNAWSGCDVPTHGENVPHTPLTERRSTED